VFFLIEMTDTQRIKQQAREQLEQLSEIDKRLLKLYMQLKPQDLMDKTLQFADRLQNTTNEKKHKEYQKQFELYQIAYILKNQGMEVKGGKRRKTLRRRRRNTSSSRRVGWHQRKSLKRN
jgi:hypothetical protein